ncbi:LacI family DNA-binding transcriptional regulator [Herbidospora sp. NBRC 101105]|uniref:LacI family DNA-binding transcriptional regulator n=1 Tax=Herbidospora sp. NBRC 101105 TaxID=3032195 RepID=UPI0024A1E6A3|nr:LacI family DNA-binding transcriptional regulator [Herbidospora sp. NBRC 101105]GLX93758.1 LacI family transcriptional regulator [Herbidospora sp. NBRC 101105]
MSDSLDSRVTVADIAAEAGVSRATVSKVLNGRSDVAPATRSQIETLLARRGYVPTKRTKRPLHLPLPRPAARRGGLLELVVSDVNSPWAAEVIRGAEQEARPARVGVVVSVFDGAPGHGQQWLEDIADRAPGGIILALSELTPADLTRIAKLGLPAVLVDPVGDADGTIPSIGAGNWGGGMAAAKHLVELGHRRIGMITGPMRLLCSQARLAGCRAALERAGLTLDDDLVQHGDFHYHSGFSLTQALLDRPEPPTAIFAGNDEQALGVYAAIQERGLRVPADVSVVGFDDVPMAQWMAPPLTTVRQPIAKMAALAVRSLLGHQDGAEMTEGRVELSTKLVVRASTAPYSPG